MASSQTNEGWRAPIPSEMHDTIVWACIGLGVVGLFGAFAAHADVAVIVTAWTAMFVKLASQANRSMCKDTALKVASGIIVAMGGIAVGMKVANGWLAFTGVGTIPAMICNAGTNAAMTYVIGRSAARVFLSADAGASVEELIKGILALFMPPNPKSI